MSGYTVIEDCSPYYIRFTHTGLKEFVDYILEIYNQQNWPLNSSESNPGFRHCRLPLEIAKTVLEKTPVAKDIELNMHRVSYFTSAPGMKYRAHKDGIDHRFSLNYTVKILDDKCVTSWYNDDELKHYPIDNIGGVSRECLGFDSSKHTAQKTMIAQPNECILFNTDIFHSWDNSQSINERIVLTLRSTTPGIVYFDDVKKVLLGD